MDQFVYVVMHDYSSFDSVELLCAFYDEAAAAEFVSKVESGEIPQNRRLEAIWVDKVKLVGQPASANTKV